ncbi:hypothetical protein LguiB_026420 [Lonicera macranthoides]
MWTDDGLPLASNLASNKVTCVTSLARNPFKTRLQIYVQKKLIKLPNSNPHKDLCSPPFMVNKASQVLDLKVRLTLNPKSMASKSKSLTANPKLLTSKLKSLTS